MVDPQAQKHVAADLEPEPRLKYAALSSDALRIFRQQGASCLAVSDKVLALGTLQGGVHLLDYAGTEVRAFKEHKARITDLSFDESTEALASCASDGSVVIYGLYTNSIERHQFKANITSIAIDPRFSARKTREFVFGTAQGTLTLCSRGWLGARETVLFQGRDPIRFVRQTGPLLAWITDRTLRVYDTSTHRRLIRVDAQGGSPQRANSGLSSVPASPRAPEPTAGPRETTAALPSLFWLGKRELYVSWPEQILVLTVTATLPPSLTEGDQSTLLQSGQVQVSMDVTLRIEPEFTVAGLAPFGQELAVLALADQAKPDEAAGERYAGQIISSAGGEREEVGEESAAIDAAIDIADEEGPPPSQAEPPEPPLSTSSPAGTTPPPEPSVRPLKAPKSASEPGPPTPPDLRRPGAVRRLMGGRLAPRRVQLKILDRRGRELSSDEVLLPQAVPGQEAPAPGEARAPVGLAVFYTASARRATRARPDETGDEEGSAKGEELGWQISRAAASPAAAWPSGSASRASQTDAPRASQPGTPRASQPGSPRVSEPGTRQASEPGTRQVSEPGTRQASEPGPCQAPAAIPLIPASTQPYKWWRDGDEPLYFIVSSRAVSVGRPREGSDRVDWLTARGRLEEALEVAETDLAVRTHVREAAGERLLAALLERGQPAAAALAARRVLGGRAAAWERWAHRFSAAGALAALAPELPLGRGGLPALSAATYDLVLAALLPAPPDHELLLRLLRAWPRGLFSVPALRAAVLDRLAEGGVGGGGWKRGGRAGEEGYGRGLTGRSKSRDPSPHPPNRRVPLPHSPPVPSRMRPLALAAVELWGLEGQHARALDMLLRLRDSGALAYAERHGLVPALAPAAALLAEMAPEAAVRALAAHHDEAAPREVVDALVLRAELEEEEEEAREEADGGKPGGFLATALGLGSGSDEDGSEACSSPPRPPPDAFVKIDFRRQLYRYLSRLRALDASAAAPFADLEVDLTAEFEPPALQSLLLSSAAYSLDAALAVCEARKRPAEAVYVLGRMGAADRALELMLRTLRDVGGALDFVASQPEEELWERLLDLGLADAELAAELLDRGGGVLDPLAVVQRMPGGLAVPRLAQRLGGLIAEARATQGLRQACARVLAADCLALAHRLYRLLREALPVVEERRGAGPGARLRLGQAGAAGRGLLLRDKEEEGGADGPGGRAAPPRHHPRHRGRARRKGGR